MHKRWIYVLGSALFAITLSACGQPGTANTSEGGMASTAASSMPMSSTMPSSSNMAEMGHSTMQSDAPFDAQFIDGMIAHHNGAIAMAEQALQASQHPEIRELAQNIIETQQQEIDQLTAWREQWYPDLPPTGGMAMDMGMMELSDDTSQPFDQRFIAAMIDHHRGAIAMAREAQTQAEHAEITQLADQIITAQEAEIAQMEQWNAEWFGS